MDDYAHHPTAIEKTLAGIATFYPGGGSSSTSCRTPIRARRPCSPSSAAVSDSADLVILHRIYASAREQNVHGITGSGPLSRGREKPPGASRYFEDPMDAAPFLAAELKPGDLFITMGAGDNWKLGRELLQGRGGTR